MLGRGLSRFLLLGTILTFLTFAFLRYSGGTSGQWHPSSKTMPHLLPDPAPIASGKIVHDSIVSSDTSTAILATPIVEFMPPQDEPGQSEAEPPAQSQAEHLSEVAQHAHPTEEEKKNSKSTLPDHYIYNDKNVYHEVFSVSTQDKKYFMIDFGEGNVAYNPNIIPHRTLNDTWIIVAQQSEHSVHESVWFAEWVCNAAFRDGKLACLTGPSILPITNTQEPYLCEGKLAFFNYNIGPHDARVFYGPDHPYALYGSNSAFACFGQWIQDFKVLVDWGFEYAAYEFPKAIEIQRPGQYGAIEKNWFIFWDKDKNMYAHHDITPKRVFAKLSLDGSVGPDLGPEAIGDEQCMAKYMPFVAEKLESVHQATNSLSITLCNRADSNCVPDDSNTFIFTIFHHKTYYAFHSNYEPYVMLFHQTSPFSIYAIGQKPIWIHGRAGPGEGTPPEWITDMELWDQTEMFYITAINWREKNLKYHGYLDDILFLSFGIEDHLTAAIDITAGELFKQLGLCAHV